MSYHNQRIAVIIPAYNAEKKIKTVVDNLPNIVDFIVIVNDCSTDNTKSILNEYKSHKIHVIHHENNGGVGRAMLTGYAKAHSLGADIFVKLDSDDQMDPIYIPNLIYPIIIKQTDYTKGNRFLNTEHLVKMPLLRRLGNLFLSFLVKITSGYWKIFDPTNGYTALHVKAYQLLNKKNIAFNYFFEISMLIELRRVNAVISDVNIPAKYADEESNLSIPHTLIHFPGKLFYFFIKRILFQYFLFEFNIVSLYIVFLVPLLIFGLLWGGYQWYLSYITGIPATSGTVLIAVLPLIFGFQLLLQAISLDIQSEPIKTLQRKKNFPLTNQDN